MLEGRDARPRGFQPVIDAIIRLAEKAAKEPRDFARPTCRESRRPSRHRRERPARGLQDHRQGRALQGRRRGEGQGHAALCRPRAEPKFTKEQVGTAFHDLQAKVVRWNILDTGSRIDGRDVKTVRPIVSEVGFLPRAHGSALFTRGETQALVVATLGTGEDEQFIDSLEGTYKERFLLHYNFPPYSVGETGRMGSPGRREIGHGKLAWRAIRPMLPTPPSSPTRSASCRRSPSRTARRRWRRCAAPRSR